MSCGCKSKKIVENGVKIKSFNFNETKVSKSKLNFLIKNIFKLLSFFIALLLLPIIIIAIIWFMFELLVLNQEIDMKKILILLSSKLKGFNIENIESEDDESEDDVMYEMLDVEDITPNTNN